MLLFAGKRVRLSSARGDADGVVEARRGVARARRALAGFPIIFIVTLALDESVSAAAQWIRRSFEPGRALLTYPSASNLRWLRAAGFPFEEPLDPTTIDHDVALRVADAFGCFGPAEHCAERLLRAREEAGVEHLFFFPVHDAAGAYEMPTREIEAFRKIIAPRLF